MDGKQEINVLYPKVKYRLVVVCFLRYFRSHQHLYPLILGSAVSNISISFVKRIQQQQLQKF